MTVKFPLQREEYDDPVHDLPLSWVLQMLPRMTFCVTSQAGETEVEKIFAFRERKSNCEEGIADAPLSISIKSREFPFLFFTSSVPDRYDTAFEWRIEVSRLESEGGFHFV